MKPPQDLVLNSAVARMAVTDKPTLGFCLKLVATSFCLFLLFVFLGTKSYILYFNSSYSVKPPALITRLYGVSFLLFHLRLHISCYFTHVDHSGEATAILYENMYIQRRKLSIQSVDMNRFRIINCGKILRRLLFFKFFNLYDEANKNYTLIVIQFSYPFVNIISTNTDCDNG
jgi:hypothetical protein